LVKAGFFINVTTVLFLSGLVGYPTGAFSGSEKPTRDQAPAQKTGKGKTAE